MRKRIEAIEHSRDAVRSSRAARDACRLTPAALVLGALLMAPCPARAEDPLRLEVVRDVVAAAAGEECVRGKLYVARSFEPGSRRIWIADTLESGSIIAPGLHEGVVREDGLPGWRIELPEAGGVLSTRAAVEADTVGEHRVLLGRRPAGSDAGAYRVDAERLEDAGASLRRLQQVYASPSWTRGVELWLQP